MTVKQSQIRPDVPLPLSSWLPAFETWTYASADDPTYTLTITGDFTSKYWAGMRVRLVQTTTKYFIVTKVAYSDPSTTLTLYGGTDYDLTNDTIETPCYSWMKAPVGFPLDPDKWTVKDSDASDRSSSGAAWQNTSTLSIAIPIGIWNVSYHVPMYCVRTVDATTVIQYVTLSTANNTESDSEFTTFHRGHASDGTEAPGVGGTHHAEKVLNLAAKTTYYVNEKTNAATCNFTMSCSTYHPGRVQAVCAYL